MKVIKWAFIALLLAVFLSSQVQAQEIIVYPAKGQSSEQMEKDKFECYTWAKGQTGFDPMQMPTASSPPPSQEKKSVGGSTLKGGVIGGAGGAVISGIAGGSSGVRKLSTASSFCRAPKTAMKRCATASVGPWLFQRRAARWC
jgi:hypothetical protein